MKAPFLCASVVAFAVGALSIHVPAASAAETVPQAPVATNLGATSNPFTIIEPSSPEYAALQRLVADGLVKQHAALLKSGRPLTRYEAAVIAAEAINSAKSLMHDGKNSVVTADDVAALRIVYDDVKDNLSALTARVDADETRLAALETGNAKQVAQNTMNPSPEPTTFKPSFELHGEFRIRPVLTSSDNATAQTTTGLGIPPGVPIIRTGTQGDGTITTGSEGLGGMQTRMRLVGSGHISPNADFIVRLSTEDTGGANNASLVHNDFSFAQYAVPNSPITFYGGKLLYCCGTPWLPDGTGLIADAVPIGLAVKYTEPGDDPHKISAWLSAASLKNAQTDTLGQPFDSLCPTNLTQNIYMGHAEAVVAPSWKIQGQALFMPSQCLSAAPSGGGTLVRTGTVTVGSLTFDHQFSPLFSGTLELLARLGTDPNTGVGWTDAGAWYLGFKYGKFGTPYGSGLDATYIDSGENSIPGNLDSIINGVDGPWNFALPYPNNVHTFDIGYNWFYGDNALVRLEWATASLRHNQAGFVSPTGLPPFTPVLITSDRRDLLILTGTFNF